MSEAPERIWIDEHGGNWSPRAGGTQCHEYVRADTAPALGVGVKPLVWECFDTWTHWARIERGSYYVEERNGRWRLGWRVNDQAFPLMHTDDTMPEGLEEAKAAAQSDYEARIRAALVDAPTDALGAEWMREESAIDVEMKGWPTYGDSRRIAAAIRALPGPTPADLLAHALMLPEVARLVEALRNFKATPVDGCIGAAIARVDAALAALPGAEGGEG